MRLQRLTIQNFRGIAAADLFFDGHALLVGPNNVGKSTIFEALDLVLGPDRLRRTPPVEEFDFYNAKYRDDESQLAIPLSIEATLVDLSLEIRRRCAPHLEWWHSAEQRLLGPGEGAKTADPNVMACLRLVTVGRYNTDEDEFEANTWFSYSPHNSDGELNKVPPNIKRLFGFLYLRALRTGSRALSLERGSLLDIILRLQGIRTGLWEQSIKRLRELEPAIDAAATDLSPVLASIEARLAHYIPMGAEGQGMRLFVSQLTREHLRKTLSFFIATSADQSPVPFQEVGTGTLNTLVLALLSFIAETKQDAVIFAMEEPEIAVPPHTQRRIAKYLLENTTQCFVTSHSPYVIERFAPEQILLLRRDPSAVVSATRVSDGSALSGKMYKRHARRGLSEAILGPGVIVVEGLTEHNALATVAGMMEESSSSYYPLDLSGVTVFPVDGDGSMPNFGAFFRALGIKAYAFYDKKVRTPEETEKFTRSFDVVNETNYSGIEDLLTSEVPVTRQWECLNALRENGQQGNLGVPLVRPNDEQVKALMKMALKSNKGNGYAGLLLGQCSVDELPPSITGFLAPVYQNFPRPKTISPLAQATEPISSPPPVDETINPPGPDRPPTAS